MRKEGRAGWAHLLKEVSQVLILNYQELNLPARGWEGVLESVSRAGDTPGLLQEELAWHCSFQPIIIPAWASPRGFGALPGAQNLSLYSPPFPTHTFTKMSHLSAGKFTALIYLKSTQQQEENFSKCTKLRKRCQVAGQFFSPIIFNLFQLNFNQAEKM